MLVCYHCRFTAFVFPTVYHMWVFRTAKARAQCLKPPPKWIGAVTVLSCVCCQIGDSQLCPGACVIFLG